MIKKLILSEFEFVFFEDNQNKNQIGLLMDEDFFDAEHLAEMLVFNFTGSNLVIKSSNREIVVQHISDTLLDEIKAKDRIFLLLVGHDIMIECISSVVCV